MKFWVICDYREYLDNYSIGENKNMYNDHPTQENISEIIRAVKTLGYECEYFGGIPELIGAVNRKEKFDDCIFLNFTDGMDEDYSRVQAPALLDILKVPYSGSGVFASVIMNNKHFCKQALKEATVDMPKSLIVNKLIPFKIKEFSNWKLPLFVKPNCEGSSLGITQTNVCHTVEDAQSKCTELLKDFDEIIIEEYIMGMDVTNYLIGNGEEYAVNSVITAKLFDKSPYAVYGILEKQNKMRTLYLDDECLPNDLVDKIKSQSILIAKILGARDICRIDYRVNLSTQKINFIEINSAPRFSSTSEIGFIAQKQNISFTRIIRHYIETVTKRIL